MHTWQEMIANVFRVCGGTSWVKGVHPKSDDIIWHKMHSNIRKRTQCGVRLTNTDTLPYAQYSTNTPPEELQCAICQFDIRHLHAVEFKPAPVQLIPPGYVPAPA